MCVVFLVFFAIFVAVVFFFFFFQAEDGIRDYKVTGVQTCALPHPRRNRAGRGRVWPVRVTAPGGLLRRDEPTRRGSTLGHRRQRHASPPPRDRSGEFLSPPARSARAHPDVAPDPLAAGAAGRSPARRVGAENRTNGGALGTLAYGRSNPSDRRVPPVHGQPRAGDEGRLLAGQVEDAAATSSTRPKRRRG